MRFFFAPQGQHVAPMGVKFGKVPSSMPNFTPIGATIRSGWRLGVVASVVRSMNEVTVHWARLVLGWVTVFGRVYHHGV